MTTKSLLRQTLLLARKSFLGSERVQAEQKIISTLTHLPEWQKARSVGCYLALPDEVATAAVVQAGFSAGKHMAAPVITQKSKPMIFYRLLPHQILEQGPMQIWQPPADEPVDAGAMDLLIVPGVGFDRAGHRLGYGGGFYDHYLERFHGWTIGLGFACQVVEKLPAQAHDHPIRLLVTEKETLRF